MWKAVGPPSLPGELLQQGVALALGRLDAVRPHDAGGAVPVQHEDQLLSLVLQLFNLSLQVCVHHLQPLRLLQGTVSVRQLHRPLPAACLVTPGCPIRVLEGPPLPLPNNPSSLTLCRKSVLSFFLFRHRAAATLFFSRRLFLLSSSSSIYKKERHSHFPIFTTITKIQQIQDQQNLYAIYLL